MLVETFKCYLGLFVVLNKMIKIQAISEVVNNYINQIISDISVLKNCDENSKEYKFVVDMSKTNLEVYDSFMKKHLLKEVICL